MKVINPATEEVIREYDEMGEEEVERLLGRAAETFDSWRQTPLSQRAALIGRLARGLRDRRDQYATLMADEMGKPIAQAEAEVDKCAWCCEFFAEHGPGMLEPEVVQTDATRSLVRFDPLGAILAIMPWNFPFWQVFRFGVPSLLAGNVVLLKHAENVPGCAAAIEELFLSQGFPEGALTNLRIGREPAQKLIGHSVVSAVTLTGSERAGIAVAGEASKHLKKCVLELGGSDPFIVLADADLERTVQVAVEARMQNAGQSCIAAKRFIVEEAVAEPFTRALVERVGGLRVGDPRDRGNDLGPLARLDLLEALDEQVRQSADRGARVLVGGRRLDRKGVFYAPTVVGNVSKGMPVFEQETFGPVAAVIPAADVEHAIELANASRYGLGASIWTSDVTRGERLAERIEAGQVFINEKVKSDPRLPFGGVKRSGYGRELSRYGLYELVNVKTVWVA